MRTMRHRRQGGFEMVEMALILPLLALLMAMFCDGAGLIAAYQIIDNAASEGARLSVAPGSSGQASAVTSQVITYAALSGLTLATKNVTVNQSLLVGKTLSNGSCSGSSPCMTESQVTVTYNYPLKFLPSIPHFSEPVSVPMSVSVIYRNFY